MNVKKKKRNFLPLPSDNYFHSTSSNFQKDIIKQQKVLHSSYNDSYTARLSLELPRMCVDWVPWDTALLAVIVHACYNKKGKVRYLKLGVYYCVEFMFIYFQGAQKDGKAPDGSSYLEAAEKEEIKALLR